MEQSRRSDLEAAGHLFADLLCAPLPWSGLPGRTKEEKYRAIMEKKIYTPADVVFDGCPGSCAICGEPPAFLLVSD